MQRTKEERQAEIKPIIQKLSELKVKAADHPENIIFDFKKIITKPARKYVEITIIDLYKYTSPMYDDENEEDAHRIIKEFIINKEKSPELVF